MRATYSLEDNKLRLYPDQGVKLSEDVYDRLKTAGFKWAAKQQLFVAPMWTPCRFDLLVDLCGTVEDEDQTLAERASERAERFEGYKKKRKEDAQNSFDRADDLSVGLVPGQPILVGHHSENRHRNRLQRIHANMRKGIEQEKTAKYWADKARAVAAHARSKDSVTTRANRIKKLKAELRSRERTVAESQRAITAWTREDLSYERALGLAAVCKYGRGLYNALDAKEITVAEAQNKIVKSAESGLPWDQRWIEHFSVRIAYETAVLTEQGGLELIQPKKRTPSTKPPLLNHDTPVIVQNLWGTKECTLEILTMTKAEWSAISSDKKSTLKTVDGSHRIRIRYVRGDRYQVFITDSKKHPVPLSTSANSHH